MAFLLSQDYGYEYKERAWVPKPHPPPRATPAPRGGSLLFIRATLPARSYTAPVLREPQPRQASSGPTLPNLEETRFFDEKLRESFDADLIDECYGVRATANHA
jgi:hypothetical protein